MPKLPPDQLIAGLQRMRADVSACPHPGKKRFKTQSYAEQRAFVLNMNAYLCVCGCWHLTSQNRQDECPICGCPLDEYTSCGCYEDLMFGD